MVNLKALNADSPQKIKVSPSLFDFFFSSSQQESNDKKNTDVSPVQGEHCMQPNFYPQEDCTNYFSNTELPQEGSIVLGHLENYQIIQKLQGCLYGTVYNVMGKTSGLHFAMKVLSKKLINEKEREKGLPETPLAEVFFAPLLSGHPHFLAIREVVDMPLCHLVVSDFAEGEDLLELLKLFSNGVPENLVRRIIRQVAEGLYWCHSKKVAVQDFSLENCLIFLRQNGKINIDSEDKELNLCKNVEITIKICDPGQAVRFDVDKITLKEIPVKYTGCVGKRFRPPEIVHAKEDEMNGEDVTNHTYLASKIDSWCLGWSTFYLLCAVEIFISAVNSDACERWRLFVKGKYEELFKMLQVSMFLSPMAKDFVLKLLHILPDRRISISEALKHPFLSNISSHRIMLFQIPQLHQILKKRRELMKKLLSKLKFQLSKSSDYNNEMLLKIGPIIPNVYFALYQQIFCTLSKPSSIGGLFQTLETCQSKFRIPSSCFISSRSDSSYVTKLHHTNNYTKTRTTLSSLPAVDNIINIGYRVVSPKQNGLNVPTSNTNKMYFNVMQNTNLSNDTSTTKLLKRFIHEKKNKNPNISSMLINKNKCHEIDLISTSSYNKLDCSLGVQPSDTANIKNLRYTDHTKTISENLNNPINNFVLPVIPRCSTNEVPNFTPCFNHSHSYLSPAVVPNCQYYPIYQRVNEGHGVPRNNISTNSCNQPMYTFQNMQRHRHNTNNSSLVYDLNNFSLQNVMTKNLTNNGVSYPTFPY